MARARVTIRGTAEPASLPYRARLGRRGPARGPDPSLGDGKRVPPPCRSNSYCSPKVSPRLRRKAVLESLACAMHMRGLRLVQLGALAVEVEQRAEKGQKSGVAVVQREVREGRPAPACSS